MWWVSCMKFTISPSGSKSTSKTKYLIQYFHIIISELKWFLEVNELFYSLFGIESTGNSEHCFAVVAHLRPNSCVPMVNRHMWFLVTDRTVQVHSLLFCFVCSFVFWHSAPLYIPGWTQSWVLGLQPCATTSRCRFTCWNQGKTLGPIASWWWWNTLTAEPKPDLTWNRTYTLTIPPGDPSVLLSLRLSFSLVLTILKKKIFLLCIPGRNFLGSMSETFESILTEKKKYTMLEDSNLIQHALRRNT
jgi:hypothetical protein